MSTPTRDQVHRAPKVLLHDHLDGGLRPADDRRARRGDRARAAGPRRRAESLGAGSPSRPTRGSLVRYLETFDAHRRGHAERPARSPASPASASRTWPRTASSTPRCATPPSSTSSGGLALDEVVEAVQEGFDAGGGRASGGRIVVRQLLTAMRTRPGRWRSPSSRSPGATAAWPASTSPARRRASRRPATSTPSSTSSARTPTSPSTPARRSGCRRSGRRSSGAARTGSVTAYGSPTT